MRNFVITLMLFFAIGNVEAMPGYVSFSTTLGSSIKISIDGKSINDSPKAKVKIRGGAGVKLVSFTVYDHRGKPIGRYSKKIKIESGFKSDYLLIFDRKKGAQLKRTGINPTTIKRLKNPEFYYRRKFYA